MLIDAHMGGMEDMGVFYDKCVAELYPPGSCGTFCNTHSCKWDRFPCARSPGPVRSP